MSKQIGIAVLGVGRWGVHLVRNFLEHPEAQVVAIVDPHPERLAAVSQRFGLNAGVVLATEWAQVRDMQEVQAVAIATPASTHYTLIADALKKGHHVLAEKPMTIDQAQSLELCQLAEQQDRQLVVDHTYLFHPAVLRGKEFIQAGSLGELRYGYATRTHLGPVRQDVDALWDLAMHDICIFNTWLAMKPIKVQATGTVWLQGAGFPRDKLGGGDWAGGPLGGATPPLRQGLSDLVWVTLTYPSGFQAFIHLCWLNPDKQRRLAVVGSLGSLIFDEMSVAAPLTLQGGYLEQSGDRWIPAGQSSEVLRVEPGEPLRRVCDRFIECVQNNRRSPVSSGWVGSELVQILSALTESMKVGGQPITIEN